MFVGLFYFKVIKLRIQKINLKENFNYILIEKFGSFIVVIIFFCKCEITLLIREMF